MQGRGGSCSDFVEPLIYKTTIDFRTVEAVSETRARMHEKLHLEKQRQMKPTGADVKLARGGIRDIEFLVQCLQRLYGGRDPWVRHGGTLLALSRLRDKEHLSPLEYAKLASAYQFMRHIEHRLQFDEDRQTHTLPAETEQLDLLARKMPQGSHWLPSAGSSGARTGPPFHQRAGSLRPGDPLAAGAGRVCRPTGRRCRRNGAGRRGISFRESAPVSGSAGAAVRACDREQRDRSFADKGQFRVLSGKGRGESGVARHARRASDDGELARCTLDVFEHSQYFADQLVSHTELLSEVSAACGEKQGRLGFAAPRDPDGLRRYFRTQMVRIQSDSVYHRVPVFKTLKRTSELAESIVRAAYEIAVAEACASAPPLSGDYTPANQMMVVALGRLGMLEFDLASDADLVFVIPDQDAHEILFWTSVAERMINVISAYTGDGVVFTIDTQAAAERARRRAGADGERVQGLFREPRRSLGGNFVHEGARDRG